MEHQLSTTNIDDDLLLAFPCKADVAPPPLCRLKQMSAFDILARRSLQPATPSYLLVSDIHEEFGLDRNFLVSEIKFVPRFEHSYTEQEFAKQLSGLTTPRNTYRGLLEKELLERERYLPSLSGLRQDPVTVVLYQAALATDCDRDKVLLDLLIAATGTMSIKNTGKPILQLPIGSGVDCHCCRTTLLPRRLTEHSSIVLYGTGPVVACQHMHTTGNGLERCHASASRVGLAIDDEVKWFCTPHFRRHIKHQVCAECHIGPTRH